MSDKYKYKHKQESYQDLKWDRKFELKQGISSAQGLSVCAIQIMLIVPNGMNLLVIPTFIYGYSLCIVSLQI